MSNIDLKAIRARLKRAIGGPWTLGGAPGGPPVVYGPGEYGAVAVIGTGTISGAHSVDEILGNAELVANAPADLAALLDHIAECHALLERVVASRGYPDEVYAIKQDARELLEEGKR